MFFYKITLGQILRCSSFIFFSLESASCETPVTTIEKLSKTSQTSETSSTGKSKFLYLESEGMKVGFDLEAGGSIGFLSHRKFARNMVNTHDKGRYIQQSYYAGQHIDRQKDGQHKAWSPWCWNPIQGGDAFLNKSKLEVSKIDPKKGEAYLKCLPMQWDMKNKQADATMEQWVTILKGGNVLKVRNKFTIHSIDPITLHDKN